VELTDLIDALSCPTAYPFPVTTVAVRQTHISAVFLAGSFAYKIKKPVNLGFLDFSTLGEATTLLHGGNTAESPAGSGGLSRCRADRGPRRLRRPAAA
jgi:hypothetical protein